MIWKALKPGGWLPGEPTCDWRFSPTSTSGKGRGRGVDLISNLRAQDLINRAYVMNPPLEKRKGGGVVQRGSGGWKGGAVCRVGWSTWRGLLAPSSLPSVCSWAISFVLIISYLVSKMFSGSSQLIQQEEGTMGISSLSEVQVTTWICI